MLAFLEQLDKEWLDDFVYISKWPLINMGYEIIPFNGENIDRCFNQFTIDPNTDICIGSVEATVKFFELCGVSIPKYIGYPESLRSFLSRKIIKTTFNDSGNDYPYFVKPSDDVKLFTGDIIKSDKDKQMLLDFNFCDVNTPIYKSEIVDFVSEYRIFVSKGEIRGIKHYRGDFKKFIDIDIVRSMVELYKDCPSAFTLDVGLTSDGRTLLVEVNDMWAIGSYGLDGNTYALLCVRRMKEILRKN
jgi:hypothetical protein